MKKIFYISLIIGFTGFSSNSYATLAFLQSCEYKWIPEYGKNYYVGIYKSSISNNKFTKLFDSYCPQTIDL